MSSWIDVSVPVNEKITTWPSDPVFRLRKFAAFENGNPCDASESSLSVHTGTHIDAPAHFIKGGAPIGAWQPEITIGRCRVIIINDPKAVTVEELKDKNIKPGERIIFKTKNSGSEWWNKPFNPDFVHVSPKAAAFLASIKPLCIGIDYLSVGSPTEGPEIHNHLLGANIWLIETMNLNNIEAGEYDLIFMPVNFTNAEGAPGRALMKKVASS